jgi:diguanylate cyclase
MNEELYDILYKIRDLISAGLLSQAINKLYYLRNSIEVDIKNILKESEYKMVKDRSYTDTVNTLSERIQYLRTEVKRYKYDFLTGLKMRMDFDEYLKILFELYEFEDRVFTLVIIDVDGLHNINRVEGYVAGDNTIKLVANTIQSTFLECTGNDCSGAEVFRIGGDEFAILVKGFNRERLETLLNSLPNVTSAYTVVDPSNISNQYASPSDVFKHTDGKVIALKKNRDTD